MMNQDQVDELRQFELYDEIDSSYEINSSGTNDTTNFMSHNANDDLDCSNYSSASVLSVYSVTSIASNKYPGDPQIAEHFLNIVRARNVSRHTLIEAKLERVDRGSLCSSGGHERCFGSSDGTRSQSRAVLRLEPSWDCEHDGLQHDRDLS